MMAAQGAAIKTVRLLLNAGARVSINTKDKRGRTALMYGAEFAGLYTPKLETVRILLAAGADASLKDNEGWTALMLARGRSPDLLDEQLIRLLEQAEGRH